MPSFKELGRDNDDDIGCRTEVDGVPGVAHIGLAWTRAYLDQRLGALA